MMKHKIDKFYLPVNVGGGGGGGYLNSQDGNKDQMPQQLLLSPSGSSNATNTTTTSGLWFDESANEIEQWPFCLDGNQNQDLPSIIIKNRYHKMMTNERTADDGDNLNRNCRTQMRYNSLCDNNKPLNDTNKEPLSDKLRISQYPITTSIYSDVPRSIREGILEFELSKGGNYRHYIDPLKSRCPQNANLKEMPVGKFKGIAKFRKLPGPPPFLPNNCNNALTNDQTLNAKDIVSQKENILENLIDEMKYTFLTPNLVRKNLVSLQTEIGYFLSQDINKYDHDLEKGKKFENIVTKSLASPTLHQWKSVLKNLPYPQKLLSSLTPKELEIISSVFKESKISTPISPDSDKPQTLHLKSISMSLNPVAADSDEIELLNIKKDSITHSDSFNSHGKGNITQTLSYTDDHSDSEDSGFLAHYQVHDLAFPLTSTNLNGHSYDHKDSVKRQSNLNCIDKFTSPMTDDKNKLRLEGAEFTMHKLSPYKNSKNSNMAQTNDVSDKNNNLYPTINQNNAFIHKDTGRNYMIYSSDMPAGTKCSIPQTSLQLYKNIDDDLTFLDPNNLNTKYGSAVRSGTIQSFIDYATSSTHNDFIFQDAFIMTYRSFISPSDLIVKLSKQLTTLLSLSKNYCIIK